MIVVALAFSVLVAVTLITAFTLSVLTLTAAATVHGLWGKARERLRAR